MIDQISVISFESQFVPPVQDPHHPAAARRICKRLTPLLDTQSSSACQIEQQQSIMYPQTPSPRKRGHRAAGGESNRGLPLPPPPLFQVAKGQIHFDEKLNKNLKLHRKSPSRHKSLPTKDWNDNVENWKERYISSPFPPSTFYSPSAQSTMTATTAPMTGTPTEIEFQQHHNTNFDPNANYFIPVVASPTNLAYEYCQPVTPTTYATSPPPPSINRYHGSSRTSSSSFTPTSPHHYNSNSTPSSYYGNNNNATATTTPTPAGYSTPRSSPTKKQRWTPNSASSTASAATRYKTELCKNWTEGIECPFGENCHYAHGENDYAIKTLIGWQRAGLIDDAESFRTKPCWTHVATGCCPFGKRCPSIHDPRLSGNGEPWLPHTETQGNHLSTDINVDALHQKRYYSIQHDNPFGDQFSMELDDFSDLYNLICNTMIGNRRRRHHISELHKLSIALQMRGESGWMYKYRPHHMIHNTHCMILQKRAFRLEKSGEAIEITLNKYQSGTNRQVLVRELAFGPDSDPTARSVTLYFNVCSDDITEITSFEAKRYRYNKSNPSNHSGRLAMMPILDSRESFVMVRPFDKDAFDLATRILQHRHDTVKAEQVSALNQRFSVMKELAKQKRELQQTFYAQKKHWINWSWPICNGREHVDEDTLVPSVETEYVPIVDPNLDQQQNVIAVKGSSIQPVWQSFVAQSCIFKPEPENCDVDVKKHLISSLAEALAPRTDGKHRLAIFKRLASGYHVCPIRALPHILKSKINDSVENQIFDRSSERCWKALLLFHEGKKDEWQIIFEHFQQSKSKKTLRMNQK